MNDLEKKAYEIYQQSDFDSDCGAEIFSLSLLLEEGSNEPLILSLRSSLYSRTGRLQEAKNDLDLAILTDSTSRNLYYNRGALNNSLGNYYAALKDFCEAVNLAHVAGDDDLIDAVEHHFIEILEKMRSR